MFIFLSFLVSRLPGFQKRLHRFSIFLESVQSCFQYLLLRIIRIRRNSSAFRLGRTASAFLAPCPQSAGFAPGYVEILTHLSKVWSFFSPIPKRIRRIFSSLAFRWRAFLSLLYQVGADGRVLWGNGCFILDKILQSAVLLAYRCFEEMVFLLTFRTFWTWSREAPISLAISSRVVPCRSVEANFSRFDSVC